MGTTMSTDTKAEPKAEVKAPVDDAIVVNDEQKAETSHKELVDKVSKALGRDEWGDKIDDAKSGATDEPNPQSTAAETKETPPEVKPEGEKVSEKPALDTALQARAEKAGFTKELAEQLHQSGQLENTLAAFDKVLVERFQAEKPEKAERQQPVEEETDEMPELDPDIYDEEIVKRDRHHKQRIDKLEEQLEGLLQDRQDAFESRFDGVLSELGYDTTDEQKCQKTFKAYKGLCEANDVSPEKCDRGLIERAHAAMYPEDVKKKTQQETVNRLRDAEGKFLTSSKTIGAPPQRSMTEEEVHDQLVSNVTSYLKKKNVQMSGL